jgi:TfoX/Sxy family transcriptional regulator of competence genes
LASDLNFVEFVTDQIDSNCDLSFRKMFGEYALYSKGKVVALVCDNQLFVKPTDAGRTFIGDVVEAPPYPGAKLAFLIEDGIDDREWLTRLITLTEKALPMPKPKARKKSKR